MYHARSFDSAAAAAAGAWQQHGDCLADGGCGGLGSLADALGDGGVGTGGVWSGTTLGMLLAVRSS